MPGWLASFSSKAVFRKWGASVRILASLVLERAGLKAQEVVGSNGPLWVF